MQPFVIPVGEPIDDPVPKGWALRSLGTWKGQESLVAYDPQRHLIDVSDLSLRDEEPFRSLQATGFTPLVVDLAGCQMVWVRDLQMATYTALDRVSRPHVAAPEGLGR